MSFEDGAGGDGPTRVNNIAHSFNLQETSYKKAEYMTWVKGYMKKLLAHIEANKPDRLATFKAQAQKLVKYVVDNFDDASFYTNSDMNDEGMVVAALWPKEPKENEGPTFIYFADGIKEEKY